MRITAQIRRFKKTQAALFVALAYFTAIANSNPLYFGFEPSEPRQPSGKSNELICSGNCPVPSADIARSGSHSLKTVVDRLSSNTSYRTEASHLVKMEVNQGSATTEYWIGFSVLVPSPYPVLNNPTYEIIFQLHSSPPNNDWSTYGGYNPNLGLQVIPQSSDGGSFLFGVRGSDLPYPQLPDNRPPSAFQKTIGSYRTDEWNNFVIHTRLDSKNGFTKVWLNGKLVADYSGTTYYRGHGPSYPKFGMYNGWRERNINESVRSRTVYHDEYRFGWGSKIGYDSVAPGGSLPLPIELLPPAELRVIEGEQLP